MGKIWIVLVNKSPKGPLSIEEVESLIAAKIISRADLAIKINENSEEKTDWKFLWQYPEFDRRLSSDAVAKEPKKPQAPAPERRAVLSEDQVAKKVNHDLPDEIALIDPADLVITAKKKKMLSSESLLSSTEDDDVETLPYENQSSKGSEWRYGFLVIMVLLIGSYVRGLFKPSGDLENSNSSPVVVRKPAQANQPIAPKPQMAAKSAPSIENVPDMSNNVSVPKPIPVPKEARKNEITLEEYQRLKESRAQQEKEEEQNQIQEREEQERLANKENLEERNAEDRRDENLEEDDRNSNEENLDIPLKKRAAARRIANRKLKRRKDAEESDQYDRDNERDYRDEERRDEYDRRDGNE